MVWSRAIDFSLHSHSAPYSYMCGPAYRYHRGVGPTLPWSCRSAISVLSPCSRDSFFVRRRKQACVQTYTCKLENGEGERRREDRMGAGEERVGWRGGQEEEMTEGGERDRLRDRDTAKRERERERERATLSTKFACITSFLTLPPPPPPPPPPLALPSPKGRAPPTKPRHTSDS